MLSKRKYCGSLILKEGKRGIGLTYALNGLKEAFTRERNFRIHLIIAFIVVCVSFYFKLRAQEWIVIMIAIFTVLIAELVNSIVERVIDYIKPDIHPEAKIIKDLAAAMVLIAALMSVILGLIIFIPKVI